MQVLEAAAARTANPWPLRRERAAELAERYPHAAEMLRLYQALTVVQESALQTIPSPLAGGRIQSVGATLGCSDVVENRRPSA